MKVYVHTDIEGVAGYIYHEDRLQGELAKHEHVWRMKRLFTAELHAATSALLQCGVREIVVNDSHGPADNLIYEEIHPAVRLIHGPSTRMPMWLPRFDDSFDAMICLGMHAMAGTKGVLPHTRLDIEYGDGKQIALNEAGLAMALAGHFRVPAILVTGDATVCAQVRQYVPNIETVAVKEALSPYTAITHVPRKSHQLIKAGVRKAVRRRKQIHPFVLGPPPYRTTLIGSTPGFDRPSDVFEDSRSFWDLIQKALGSVYDYDLYDAQTWPLVPRGEPILNKHERAYRESLKSPRKTRRKKPRA
ncbi:MAG: M55 family metallopeptidase [Kiritimatiellae bacterium]|nr:M55 family metallopeptidase [Kiritimatiellia bacterium]